MIEAITGLSYIEAWETKICKLLELNDTYGKLPKDYFEETPFYLRQGDTMVQVNYLNWRQNADVEYINPSSGLFSTSKDYSKFLNGFKKLVSNEVFEKASQQQNIKHYGYGFQVYDDIGLYGHIGTTGFAGFSNGKYTFIYWSPTILNADNWIELLRNSKTFTPKSQEELTYYRFGVWIPIKNQFNFLELEHDYSGDYLIYSKIEEINGRTISLEEDGIFLKRKVDNNDVDYWARIGDNRFVRVNLNKNSYYPGNIILIDKGTIQVYSKESPFTELILTLEAKKK